MTAAPPLTALQRAYFWTGAVLPIPSIALYVLTPGGTVQHFNGVVTNAAKFWCSVAASGDAVVSFLMFAAIYTKSAEVRKLVLRANWLYALFHFGAFWYWHTYGDAHKSGLMYPFSIGITTAALVAWGL